jgi:hypothetical protein
VKSLALIGNASGPGAEGAINCSEAFSIRRLEGRRWQWWALQIAVSHFDDHQSTAGCPLAPYPWLIQQEIPDDRGQVVPRYWRHHRPLEPPLQVRLNSNDGRHPNSSQQICKRKLGSLVNQWNGVYTEPKVNENPLIGMRWSFQGQLDEICPHSVSDLRAL